MFTKQLRLLTTHQERFIRSEYIVTKVQVKKIKNFFQGIPTAKAEIILWENWGRKSKGKDPIKDFIYKKPGPQLEL